MTSSRPATTGSFARNVLRMLAAEGLTLPMQVATGILTARFLGPYDRGLYSLLLLIPRTLEALLKLGIAPANVYMLCRKKVAPDHIVTNSLLFALGLGSLAFLLLPFQDVLNATLLANVNGWYLAVTACMVPLYLLSAYLTSILYALDRFRAAASRSVIAAAARLCGTFVVLVLLHAGLFEAFLVNVVVALLTALWLLRAVLVATSPSFRPSLEVASTTVRFGFKSHAQGLVTALHLRLDYYLIAYFLTPADVAFYAIATNIAELVTLIHWPVSVVLYPRLAASSGARMHHTTLTACRHVLFLESLAALAIFVGGEFAVATVYGQHYMPVVQPLMVVLPGAVMLSLANLVSRNFASRDRQQITVVTGGVALGANIALNIVLLPTIGILGAALASTISYSLATVLLLLRFRAESGISLVELVRPRRSDLEFYKTLPAKLVARTAVA